MNVELTKEYRFEAAHHLPNVPPGHKCARVHGHSYKVEVSVAGPVDPTTGWLIDFGAVGAQVGGWAQRTGPMPMLGDETSPWRRRQDLARTLCHDAKQPLASLAALAQRLDNGGDEMRALSEQILEKVGQVDTLLAAISDVVDAPPGGVPQT